MPRHYTNDDFDYQTDIVDELNSRVKTVNGQAPDTNGNITIPTSGGVFASIEDYGAVPGGDSPPSMATMTNNLNAINAALKAENMVIIPPKIYWINGSINVKASQILQGMGSRKSIIRLPSGSNYPAVIMDECDGAKIGSFGIEYNDWTPNNFPGRNAVFFRHIVRNSEVHDMELQSVYRGFALDDSAAEVHNIFNVNFRNLKAFWVAKNYMYFNPSIGGNTGCVFDNIYVHNGMRGNRPPDSWDTTLYFFRKFTESVFLQVNAEWTNVKNAFFLESNRQLLFLSTHLEGLDLYQPESALIHVVDCRVVFETIDIYNCKFRSGGRGGFFRVNINGSLKVDGFSEWETTIENGTQLRGIISDSTGNDKIEIEGLKEKSGLGINWNPTTFTNPNGTPKLVRFNDQLRYFELVSPDGSRWKMDINNNGVVNYTKI